MQDVNSADPRGDTGKNPDPCRSFVLDKFTPVVAAPVYRVGVQVRLTDNLVSELRTIGP